MKKIIGVDQSYTGLGFSVIDENGCMVDFGKVKTKIDPNTDIYDRALETATVVYEKMVQHGIKDINLEGLAFGMMGSATRDLAGLLFTIITYIKVKDPTIIYNIVPPTTLKKFATGSGKADKAAMIAALPEEIRQRFTDAGFKKTTGLADLSDSYWLATYNSNIHLK